METRREVRMEVQLRLLQKKAGTTTDGSASKGTSGSKAAKTGDPANVLGLLGLAFSSLGAGVGGFAWKRKRK